jgi:predicted dehydrogenase
MGAEMLKVALIGCGKIADVHASLIARSPLASLVSCCDSNIMMAKQLAERYNIPGIYDDVFEMIGKQDVDAVHVTTPPQSHFEIGKVCLGNNIHVYMEKPFTVSFREAETLLEIATERGLKVTVGHDIQYTHGMKTLRKLISEGYHGDQIIHLESVFCYDLSDEEYAKSFLLDTGHWVRKLPGGLLQNIMSHGIAKIAEYLGDEEPQIQASSFTSNVMTSAGGENIKDELRAMIKSGQTTAYFTFSTQMKPSHSRFSLFGNQNGVSVDDDNSVILKLGGKQYKSYANKFFPPLIGAKENASNLIFNLNRFLHRDFHMSHGMYNLINKFYEAILQDRNVPISYREILLTSIIVEKILQQIGVSFHE